MKTLKMRLAPLLPATLVLAAMPVWAGTEITLPADLPPYGQEKPLKAPAVKEAKLANGLTVWLVSQPGFPQIAYSVTVRGGFAADPPDRPGISELVTETIDQGTQAQSAKQIAEAIQSAGGDIGAGADKDTIRVSTTVLSDKAETGLKVLADVLQHATFPDDEVALAKRNLADSLRQQEAEPSFLAARAMARVLFKQNPYAVIAPTQESIAASTPEEVRDIYGKRFRPDAALFIAVGDFETGKMLAMVKTALGGWQANGKAPVTEVPHPAGTPEHDVSLVSRPGSVQTTLEFAGFGPLRTAPDYEATEVANAIYGGMFGSRLVKNIREDKGYTYSPDSDLDAFRDAAVVATRADVRNAVTAASLNEIVYELNRMATTSPTDQELTTARRFIIGLEAIRLQRRASVARQLAALWVNGLPPAELGNHGRKIAKVTAADVDAAAAKYFPASRMAIVAVGEKKVVEDAVAPFNLKVIPAAAQ